MTTKERLQATHFIEQWHTRFGTPPASTKPQFIKELEGYTNFTASIGSITVAIFLIRYKNTQQRFAAESVL